MLILRRPQNGLEVGITIPSRDQVPHQVHSNFSDGQSFFLVQDTIMVKKYSDVAGGCKSFILGPRNNLFN